MYKVVASILPSCLNFIFNFTIANRLSKKGYTEIVLVLILINSFVLFHNRWLTNSAVEKVDGFFKIDKLKYLKLIVVLVPIIVFVLIKSAMGYATVLSSVGLIVGLCWHEINKRCLIISGELKQVLISDVVKSILMCIVVFIDTEVKTIMFGLMLIVLSFALYTTKTICKKSLVFEQKKVQSMGGDFGLVITEILGPMLFIAYQSITAILVKTSCRDGDLAYLGIIGLFLSICNPFANYLDNFVLTGANRENNQKLQNNSKVFKKFNLMLSGAIMLSASFLMLGIWVGYPSILLSMDTPTLWLMFAIFSIINVLQTSNNYLSSLLHFQGYAKPLIVFDVLSIIIIFIYADLAAPISITKLYVVFLCTIAFRAILCWLRLSRVNKC